MKIAMLRMVCFLIVWGGVTAGSSPGDELAFPAAAPHEVGLRAERLREMSRWVRTEGLDVRAMLVVRKRRLALEWYSADVTRDHNHNVFSITKSVVGTLAGIALQQNKLPGTAAPLRQHLPAWQVPKDSVKQQISLAQLLTMQSGFPVTRGNQPTTDPSRILFDRIHAAQDRCQVILELPLAAKPGQRFAYNNNDPQVVAAIIEHTYGMDIHQVGRKLLFDRMQFAHVDWHYPDATGSCPGGYGLRLRAIDMAKLGQLYLDEGRWQNDRILSAAWCREATSDQTGIGYGYYWWTEKNANGGKQPFAAKGVRGQRIFVDPENELVFVVAADLPPGQVHAVTSKLM